LTISFAFHVVGWCECFESTNGFSGIVRVRTHEISFIFFQQNDGRNFAINEFQLFDAAPFLGKTDSYTHTLNQFSLFIAIK
jgi:curli biogenesis system outer membrane secretion channel CsgG